MRVHCSGSVNMLDRSGFQNPLALAMGSSQHLHRIFAGDRSALVQNFRAGSQVGSQRLRHVIRIDHMELKFYSKSGQNAIVMRFCPLCLFSQLKLI